LTWGAQIMNAGGAFCEQAADAMDGATFPATAPRQSIPLSGLNNGAHADGRGTSQTLAIRAR
jgi:hypothetical protein